MHANRLALILECAHTYNIYLNANKNTCICVYLCMHMLISCAPSLVPVVPAFPECSSQVWPSKGIGEGQQRNKARA